MNGADKEEGHRPRPLSGGLWTLFSWLRRSERASSSDSLSSVGSARTAVSFDFLAPGNCDFTNTALMLTAPPNPPTETYKKRLQERNLRRQRERDITLHRKYGLFRDYDHGFDGFSLPGARRTSGSADRPGRGRRAASEYLPRRPAYVPGKRRAPLPPALTTSASLPRSFKRKRPAPKPPVRNAVMNDKDQPSHNLGQMNSNTESDARMSHNYESLVINKTDRCDKKMSNTKESKTRTDKSFLKNIFDNRKRNSAIEPTSLRLLPSISELDKQAAEIIENNKLRQNRSNLSGGDNIESKHKSTTSYEANSWFCTTCLKKFNSSVITCNYCLPKEPEKKENDNVKHLSSKNSIYTQTNTSVNAASSSQCRMDERKRLKEILKEMKDSLPKKQRDTNKASNIITEIPTLRIGSIIYEKYKDTSQPSSSQEIYHVNNDNQSGLSRILPISSLLPETHGNLDRNININFKKSSDLSKNNIIQHNVTLAFEGNSQSTSCHMTPLIFQNMPSSSKKQSEKIITADNKAKQKESAVTNVPEDEKITYNQKQGMPTADKNNKGAHSENSHQMSFEEQFLKFSRANSVVVNSVTVITSHLNNKSPDISKVLPAKKLDSNLVQTSTSKLPYEEKITNTNQVKSSLQNTTSPVRNMKELYLQKDAGPLKTLETSSVTVKAESILHTPLKISSLLNPLYNPMVPNVNENKSKENIGNTQLLKETNINSNSVNKINNNDNPDVKENNGSVGKTVVGITSKKTVETTNTLLEFGQEGEIKNENLSKDETPAKLIESSTSGFARPIVKENKGVVEKQTSQAIITDSSEIKIETSNALLEPFQNKEGVVRETELDTRKAKLNEPKALPSTSGYSGTPTVSCQSNIDKLDHYDRRRHLISLLEQSIAKGDEVAAAEAAVKLAKLKLSCSVLSYSSQIVGESSKAHIEKRQSDQNIAVNNSNSLTLISSKHNIPTAKPALVAKHESINKEQAPKTESVLNKLPESEVTPDKDDNRRSIDKEPNVIQHLLNNELSSSTQGIADDIVTINVWIEDKQAARGPIRLRILRRATMAHLRRQAEVSLGIAGHLQRWIVGQTLCTDDATIVSSLAGVDFRAPFYLCLVQSEKNGQATQVHNDQKNDKIDTVANQNGEFYIELMKLEKQSLVQNVEPFECGVCMDECARGAGVVLRDCIHSFCRECLSDVVQHCQEPEVPCPATGCSGILQEREIRTIVSAEQYERWLARSLATAECGTRNTFHCRTRDCKGWAFCDPDVRRFPCPVCKHTNCVQCQAIHEGETCEHYQTKLHEAVTAAETNKDDEGTQALLNSLISRGEALECPECKAIITKKWGCDWVKCLACKTEICWVTKGRRWGPGGRGDTSGGCRCGVDGQRCHPSCGYCH